MGDLKEAGLEEQLTKVLKAATKVYRSDRPLDPRRCMSCERHWLDIKRLIRRTGGFHEFKEALVQGRRANREMKGGL